MAWQRIDKAEYGYTIDLPMSWVEHPPDLRNSPLETARFVDPDDGRHSVIVFRTMPDPNTTPERLAARAQAALAGRGCGGFSTAEGTVGGVGGIQMDCSKHDAGRVMAVRQSYVTGGEVGLILATNTTAPDEDEVLISSIAARFGVLLD